LQWLEGFDEQHARNWGLLYNNDAEAAMCEAAFWGVLTDCGVTVEPNADLLNGSSAPDFRCTKDGFEFYFEATCIKIETATRKTGLQHPPRRGCSHYSLLNGAICNECVQKAAQCGSVDASCVLGVGTFHSHAAHVCIDKIAMEWLLTGEQMIGLDVDTRLGRAVGETYSTTDLHCATFFRSLKGTDALTIARSPISAVVVGGFVAEPQVFGVCHPKPLHEFRRDVLSRIEFCQLKPGYEGGSMETEWI
jgi:hypothetical protein